MISRLCLKQLTALMCAGMISLASGITVRAQEAPEDMIGKIMDEMSIQEKVGQMIIADFRNWNENPDDEDSELVPVTSLREEIREAISRDLFGGIILFAENCPGNEQTAKLAAQMQEANADGHTNQIPLLIAIDQEGGRVARLGQGTRWIGNMALAATGDPENARIAAKCIGEELIALGINTDFAPVLDVNNNPGNPVIGLRSFSDDPQMTAEYGVSYLEGLKDSKVISSLKHFPGHGDVVTDSHVGFPVVDKSYEELKECELVPFAAAIEAGADMVMTAHTQYPQIETGTYTSITTGEEVYLPATLSRKILTEILREDMGFEGVIVSDALNMAAIADNFDKQDIAVMAVEAGIDLFLMPVPVTDTVTLEELEAFISYLCEKVEDGTLPESRIDESVRRILSMKAQHGLLDLQEEPAAASQAETTEQEEPAAASQAETTEQEEPAAAGQAETTEQEEPAAADQAETTEQEKTAAASQAETTEQEETAAAGQAETSEEEEESAAASPAGTSDKNDYLEEAVKSVGSTEHHDLEWEVMTKAVTLLKNDGDALPVKAQPGEKVLVLYGAADRTACGEFARQHLIAEGLLSEDVVFEGITFTAENKEECLEAAKEADHVIGVSMLFSAGELNPDTEDGADLAVLDKVMAAVHEDGKPFILISANLPYDAARFQDADAIVVSYGSVAMKELPEGKSAYSANLPAALCGIFGEYAFCGTLPVNILRLDDQYQYTDEVLYDRGSSF